MPVGEHGERLTAIEVERAQLMPLLAQRTGRFILQSKLRLELRRGCNLRRCVGLALQPWPGAFVTQLRLVANERAINPRLAH